MSTSRTNTRPTGSKKYTHAFQDRQCRSKVLTLFTRPARPPDAKLSIVACSTPFHQASQKNRRVRWEHATTIVPDRGFWAYTLMACCPWRRAPVTKIVATVFQLLVVRWKWMVPSLYHCHLHDLTLGCCQSSPYPFCVLFEHVPATTPPTSADPLRRKKTHKPHKAQDSRPQSCLQPYACA